MNEVVIKTLTLLALAKAEEKGNAPVTNVLNYAHSTLRGAIICAELCEKEEGIAFSDFFSGSLIISPLPPIQARIILEHEVME